MFRGSEKRYLYRAIDEDGVVIDILLREHRDTASAEAFFRQAIQRSGVIPSEVVTDHHQPYVKAVVNHLPRCSAHPDGPPSSTWRDDQSHRTEPCTHARSTAQQPWTEAD